MKKESWDSSSEKAKTLKIENFGAPDEVRKTAKPVREASNRKEAAEILKEIIKHSPYTSKSGLTARVPGKIIGKMVSSEAVNASFLPEAHYLAVANIDCFQIPLSLGFLSSTLIKTMMDLRLGVICLRRWILTKE